MWKFQKWWSAGESPGALVFRQSYWMLFWTVLAVLAALVWLPPARAWYALAVFSIAIARAVAERRRAYIFDDTGMAYRPAFGPPQHFEFADLVSIRRDNVARPLLTRPQVVRGLRFNLNNGRELCFPLDFRDAQRITQKICECAPSVGLL